MLNMQNHLICFCQLIHAHVPGATALLYAVRNLDVGFVKVLVSAISGSAQSDAAHIPASVNGADEQVRPTSHLSNHFSSLIACDGNQTACWNAFEQLVTSCTLSSLLLCVYGLRTKSQSICLVEHPCCAV